MQKQVKWLLARSSHTITNGHIITSVILLWSWNKAQKIRYAIANRFMYILSKAHKITRSQEPPSNRQHKRDVNNFHNHEEKDTLKRNHVFFGCVTKIKRFALLCWLDWSVLKTYQEINLSCMGPLHWYLRHYKQPAKAN